MSDVFALVCAIAVVIVAGALVLALAVIAIAIIVRVVWDFIEEYIIE